MANEIVLTFDYELPPTAEDLGDVFTALSRDYRETSDGGTLVVTRLETGSIIVTLTDAVLTAAPYAVAIAGAAISAMAAANTIDKFFENIQKWFGLAKMSEGKKRLYKKGKKSSGQRSVEAIVNTAAKTRSRAKVKHTNANGETLEVEITPAEALEIRDAAASNAEPKKVHSDTERYVAHRPEIDVAVEKLRLAGSQGLTPTQIEVVVEIIVSALQTSGAEHALHEIASRLDAHGLFEFAQAVRRHIRGSGGTLLPPITT